jgi:sugar transferase (PEP-CTERM/EpsH1 system associated)
MRILYLCHRIPYPPNKGEKIRAFHQLRALSHQHQVDLFTLADDPADLAHRTTLLQFCSEVVVAPVNPKLARLFSLPYLFTPKPLTLPYFRSAELHRAVAKALARRSYDRVFIYSSAMAQYIGDEWRGIPTVLDLVDVDSDKWLQYANFTRFPMSAVYRREGHALRRYERSVCERFSCVLVSTEREGQLLREISPLAHLQVIANGVDTDYFKPVESDTQPKTPTMIFMGDMSYFPNQDAVTFFSRRVLPLVRQEIADARFLIAGRNPNAAVLKLQQIQGVEVTGYVPDVRTQLARAQVSVAPFSITAGIPNKILEAMSFGLPVVATTMGSRGLMRQVAETILTGDTPDALAKHLVVLLRDPALAKRTGLDGRHLVAHHCTWNAALEQLLQVVTEPAADQPLIRNESFLA